MLYKLILSLILSLSACLTYSSEDSKMNYSEMTKAEFPFDQFRYSPFPIDPLTHELSLSLSVKALAKAPSGFQAVETIEKVEEMEEVEKVDILFTEFLAEGVLTPAYRLPIDYTRELGYFRDADAIYGNDTTIGQRKIIRMHNYFEYGFNEARVHNLPNIENDEHLEAMELLTRVNIYFAHQFLNELSATNENMFIGHSLLEDAKSNIDFTLGLASGVTTTIISNVSDTFLFVGKSYEVLTTEEITIQRVHELFKRIDGQKIRDAFGQFIVKKLFDYFTGDSKKKGEVIGSFATEIALNFALAAGIPVKVDTNVWRASTAKYYDGTDPGTRNNLGVNVSDILKKSKNHSVI